MKRISKLGVLALSSLLSLSLFGCAAQSDEDDALDDDDTVDVSQTEEALAAGCAHCTIVVQQSIRGVKIGMSTTQVRKILGAPGAIRTETSEIFGKYRVYRYGATEISFFLRGGGVFDIVTRSTKVKTSSGIGVGSTEDAVEAKVSGVRCRTDFGFRNCVVGRQDPGKVVTTFAMANGKVTSVGLGMIID